MYHFFLSGLGLGLSIDDIKKVEVVGLHGLRYCRHVATPILTPDVWLRVCLETFSWFLELTDDPMFLELDV